MNGILSKSFSQACKYDLGMAGKGSHGRVFSGRGVTFPDKSTMLFGPTPEEGDSWRCDGPCSFKYPEVPSR
jgi:hypothetical protein